MRRRLALGSVLIALMAGFGLAVYTGLGLIRQVRSGGGATSPTARNLAGLHPAVQLPGSLYLAAGGDLLRLHGDSVEAVLTHDGTRRWSEPAIGPGGALVLVGRGAESSDLYTATANGAGLRPLTDDAAPPLRDGSLELDHWAFDPRSDHGGRLWYSYDSPKAGFRVDLAVWSLPSLADRATAATRWSTPDEYTGGDVEPVPLPQGGVIFARYVADQGHMRSRLWLQTGPRDPGHPLTAAADDCSQPDLSPDGATLAMVCTQGGQTAHVEVATFDGHTLSPLRVVGTGTLCAFPTWAPDGRGLVYLAPATEGTGFTLWWLAGAAGPTPSAAHQVLDGITLDATSRPAWAT